MHNAVMCTLSLYDVIGITRHLPIKLKSFSNIAQPLHKEAVHGCSFSYNIAMKSVIMSEAFLVDVSICSLTGLACINILNAGFSDTCLNLKKTRTYAHKSVLLFRFRYKMTDGGMLMFFIVFIVFVIDYLGKKYLRSSLLNGELWFFSQITQLGALTLS